MASKIKFNFEAYPTYTALKNHCPFLEVETFKQLLPDTFTLEERNGDLYATVTTKEIQRELDRIFFLTGIRVKFDHLDKNGFPLVVKVFRSVSGEVKSFNNHISSQKKWNDKIEVQLKLWDSAMSTTDTPLKIIFLFQIIELENMRKPKDEYCDSSQPPDPLKECYLLRDIVAHIGENPHKQTKVYLNFLGISSMPGFGNLAFNEKISKRVHVLQEKANDLLMKSMTKTNCIKRLCNKMKNSDIDK